MISSAISSALAGIQYERQQVDRAARSIAAAGLGQPAAPSAPAASAPPQVTEPELDMAVAITTLLIAQRAFAAQLRVIETADAMTRETLRMTDRSEDR